MSEWPIDENMYPRDGSDYGVADEVPQYFDEPIEQKEDNAKQTAVQQASYPIMGDIVDWFDAQIAGLDSRQAIHDFASAYDIDRETAGLAFDAARNILQAKLIEFGSFRRER